MEKAQRAYHNFKNANAEFRQASSNFRSRWPAIYSIHGSRLSRAYNDSHQRMINAYQRRNRAHAAFVRHALKFGIKNASVNNMKKLLNQVMYAPPNRPGGFGGLGYEMTALRWRKKPNRAKSVSPARRRSPMRRAHSA
jgi:hypothetical protein